MPPTLLKKDKRYISKAQDFTGILVKAVQQSQVFLVGNIEGLGILEQFVIFTCW